MKGKKREILMGLVFLEINCLVRASGRRKDEG